MCIVLLDWNYKLFWFFGFNKYNFMSSTKIILASQVRSINQYKSLRSTSSRFKNNILMLLTETRNYVDVFYFNKNNRMSSTKQYFY